MTVVDAHFSADPSGHRRLVRKAFLLAFFSIAYNLVEGAASIWFGADDDSLALMGFGADSLIEVASAMIVLWRLMAETGNASVGRWRTLARERVATRFIGWLFVMLGLSIFASGVWGIWTQRAPETSIPGFVIALISLLFMFGLWRAKIKVGKALDSSTLMQDAACSLACLKLSTVLLLGSVVFLVVPTLWWVDSFAAGVLAVMIVREGIVTVRASHRRDFKGGCGCPH